MKKTFLVIFALLVGIAQSQAQFGRLQKKLIYIGVRGGANFSQLNTDNLQISKLGSSVKDFFNTNADYRSGYVGGVYVRIGHRFFIQPEVLLSSKGGKVSFVPQAGGSPVNIDVKMSQFDIPVLLGLKMGAFRLNAGPVASLSIAQGTDLKDALKQYTSQSIDNTFKQSTIGYQAGVGLDLGSFNFDVRYEGNLSNISQLNLQNNAQFNSKLSLWQLTVGFVIL
jgi:Outer membrane protein beta-barrel domain